jgi:hypothetical protein
MCAGRRFNSTFDRSTPPCEARGPTERARPPLALPMETVGIEPTVRPFRLLEQKSPPTKSTTTKGP